MAKRALLGLIAIVLLLIISSILQLAGAESHPTSAVTQLSNPRISESAATPSPWWRNDVVDAVNQRPEDVGFRGSLVLDSSGKPHISYSNDAAVRYAYLDGASWQLERVVGSDHPTKNSIRLDRAGRPHIVYIDYAQGAGEVVYVYWNGTAWNSEIVGSSHWGDSVALELDKDDHPHIVYEDYAGDEVLRYADWDGMQWLVKTLGGVGDQLSGPSLALDAADHPHISYYDQVAEVLRYARWEGTAWIVETVDTGTIGRNHWLDSTSLSLDDAGYPHISYYDAREIDLRYAHWDGRAWKTEIVESDDNVGLMNSLAVDASGRPHVVYTVETDSWAGEPGETSLKYARFEGDTWHVEIVSDAAERYGDVSLALDPSGKPRISYFGHHVVDSVSQSQLMFAERLDQPLTPSPTPTSTETPQSMRVVLPLVMKQPTMTPTPTPTPTMTPTNTPSPTPTSTSSPAGIYGRVTRDGASAAGIPLKLRSWTGSTYLDIASTATNASGNFSFVGIPSAPSGQEYSVNCGGQGADTLLYWTTRSLDDYAAGSSVHIGDFDIADVALVSPADRATVSLPAEFRWTPRPASPRDSYVWAIFNSSSYWPWYWGPSLGYTGSYTRYSLPSGFNFGTQYTWYVEIHSPDGGSGASRERRGVTFSGAVATGSQVR